MALRREPYKTESPWSRHGMQLQSRVLCSSQSVRAVLHTHPELGSCVRKDWPVNRARREFEQPISEIRAAFTKLDQSGLVVVPVDCELSFEDGLATIYPYAGVTVDTRFEQLYEPNMQSTRLYEVNRLAVHSLLGLQQLHERGMVVRDVKPSNMLWDPEDDVYRLSDMGLLAQENCKGMAWDRSYAAQDQMQRVDGKRVLHHLEHGPDSNTRDLDIWALGVVLVESAVGYRPPSVLLSHKRDFSPSGSDETNFKDLSYEEQEAILEEARLDRCATFDWLAWVEEKVGPLDAVLVDFLGHCLCKREQRWRATELLGHPYILRLLDQERQHITSTLEGWRDRCDEAFEVGQLVKLAKQQERVFDIQTLYLPSHALSYPPVVAHPLPNGDFVMQDIYLPSHQLPDDCFAEEDEEDWEKQEVTHIETGAVSQGGLDEFDGDSDMLSFTSSSSGVGSGSNNYSIRSCSGSISNESSISDGWPARLPASVMNEAWSDWDSFFAALRTKGSSSSSRQSSASVPAAAQVVVNTAAAAASGCSSAELELGWQPKGKLLKRSRGAVFACFVVCVGVKLVRLV